MGKDFIIIECNARADNVKTQPKMVTSSTMTTNEYIKLLALRARQIMMGASFDVEWNEPFNAVKIAEKELIERKSPLIIVRKIPDAKAPGGFRDEIHEPSTMNIRSY
jgi:DNA-directed RNA polymerase subunit K/omega